MAVGKTLGDAIVVAIQGQNANITAAQLAQLQSFWEPMAAAIINNYVTNWTAYTPTLGPGWTTATTTPTGKWRRVGDSIEVRVHIAITGTPSGALTTVSLPTDATLGALTIDTTKLAASTANKQNLGYGNIIAAGTGNTAVDILYSSTSAVRPAFYTTGAGGAGAALTDAGISATAPGVFASGDSIDFFFQVPITQYAL